VTIRVRLFAILKERAGADCVEVDLGDAATVADALRALSALPGLSVLAEGGVRMAVNREYATAETRLRSTDELALIPPVSGGDAGAHLSRVTGTVHARVSAEPLALEPLIAFVSGAHAGAVVTFQGLPRDIPVLEYEAYAEMALEKMVAILVQTTARHGLCRAAAEHRIGPVRAGEASIAIAVSAPHRAEAFAGARDALDRIKAEAPIWKTEVTAGGDRTRPEGVLPG
jgi:molybdopterin converting factor subunit 1